MMRANFMKFLVLTSIILVTGSIYAASCPDPAVIHCDSSSCKTTDPNFNVLSYTPDPNNHFTVTFTGASATCLTQEGGTCDPSLLWSNFVCSYQVGDTGNVNLGWLSQNWVQLGGSWQFQLSNDLATCATSVKQCTWPDSYRIRSK